MRYKRAPKFKRGGVKMKKTAIIVACILALITLVSCQDKGYDAKTEEAQNLYNNGKILPAIRLLDEAIEKNDFKYEAYAMRGYFYWQLGNFECAVSDYKNAIKRGGKYYNYPLGKLFIDIGRPLDAVEYLNDYIKYDKKIRRYTFCLLIYINNPEIHVWQIMYETKDMKRPGMKC